MEDVNMGKLIQIEVIQRYIHKAIKEDAEIIVVTEGNAEKIITEFQSLINEIEAEYFEGNNEEVLDGIYEDIKKITELFELK